MKALPFAVSDAGRFAHAHIKSGSLIAFDGKIMKPKNWHSVQDMGKFGHGKHLLHPTG